MAHCHATDDIPMDCHDAAELLRDMEEAGEGHASLTRLGVLAAVAITIHSAL
jgi:hypothetical protein